MSVPEDMLKSRLSQLLGSSVPSFPLGFLSPSPPVLQNLCRLCDKTNSNFVLCDFCAKGFICMQCIEQSPDPLTRQLRNKDSKTAFCCGLACDNVDHLVEKGFERQITFTPLAVFHKAHPFLPTPNGPAEDEDEEEFFSRTLDSCPVVQERIPVSNLEQWQTHTKKSGSHFIVGESVYIYDIRTILQKQNNFCNWTAKACRYLKSNNTYVSRFQCNHPGCSVSCLIRIDALGQVQLQFSSGDSAINQYTITHKRDGKYRSPCLRQPERAVIQDKVKHLTVQQHYIQENAKLSVEELAAGRSNPSKRVLRELHSEAKKKGLLDPIVEVAIRKMAQRKEPFVKKFLLAPTIQIFCFSPEYLDCLNGLSQIATFGVDGTVVPSTESLGCRQLEMFTLTVENPIVGLPPIPAASAWLSKKTIVEIQAFLSAVCSASSKPFKPIHIVTDKSWALIRSILLSFNDQGIQAYILCIYLLLTDAEAEVLLPTILTICNFHYGAAVKRWLKLKVDKKQQHFFSILSVALQSCLTWSTILALSRAMIIICYSKKYSPAVSMAKDVVKDMLKDSRSKNADLQSLQAETDTPNRFDSGESPENVEDQDHPVAESPFRKDLLQLKEDILATLSEDPRHEDNPLYCPAFATYQIDEWLAFPVHTEALYDLVQKRKQPNAIPGFRSASYKNSTNNMSEKSHQLFKLFLGKKKLRLDEIIDKQEMFVKSALNDHKKQGLPLIAASKKRRRLRDIDQPEVFRKKRKTTKIDDLASLDIEQEERMTRQSFEICSSPVLYSNKSNACSTLSVINLFSGSFTVNKGLVNYLEDAASAKSDFLKICYDVLLKSLHIWQNFSEYELEIMESSAVEYIHTSFLHSHAMDHIKESQHEPELVIPILYGAPIKVNNTFSCMECNNQVVKEDVQNWFTVANHEDAEISAAIRTTNGTKTIHDYECLQCCQGEKRVSAFLSNEFACAPVDLLLRLGRDKVFTGTHQQLTTVTRAVSNLTPNIVIECGGEEIHYDLGGGICFQGHDTCGHYTYFAYSVKGKYVVEFDEGKMTVITTASKEFKRVAAEAVFLLYHKTSKPDYSLMSRLRLNLPIMAPFQKMGTGLTLSLQDFKKNVVPAFACTSSLLMEEYGLFVELLFSWDSLSDKDSLSIWIESHPFCTYCCKSYVGGFHLSVSSLVFYNYEETYQRAEQLLKDDFANQGCAHIQNLVLQVSHLPDSFILYNSFEETHRLLPTLNQYLELFTSFDQSAQGSTYFVEGVYHIGEHKFFPFKNGKFLHDKTRKGVRVDGKHIFFVKKACASTAPVLRDMSFSQFQESLTTICGQYESLSCLQWPRVKVAEVSVEDGRHNDIFPISRFNLMTSPTHMLSSSDVSSFFVSAIGFFQLQDEVTFLGPSYHEELVELGTPLNVFDANKLEQDCLVGVTKFPINPGKGDLDKFDCKDHMVLYVVDWKKSVFAVFDPLGKVSTIFLKKLYKFLLALSARRRHSQDWSYVDLSAQPWSPKHDEISCLDCGVLISEVGLSLLLGLPCGGRDVQSVRALRALIGKVILNGSSLH